jgi:hypothetical protein
MSGHNSPIRAIPLDSPSVTPEVASDTSWLSHVREGDSKQIYNRCLEKGKRLMGMMLEDDKTAGGMFSPPRESAKSEFSHPDELEANGYFMDELHEQDIYLGCEKALGALGLSDKATSQGGENRIIAYRYDARKAENEDLELANFDAYFRLVVNQSEGAIVAIKTLSLAGWWEAHGRYNPLLND